MEKNGAINSQTPSCGCGQGGCKKAADKDTIVYPTDVEQANTMDADVTKNLIDTVKTASVRK